MKSKKRSLSKNYNKSNLSQKRYSRSKSERYSKKSIIYDLHSHKTPCKDNPKYKTPFVRKYLNVDNYQHKTELMIAKKLYKNPLLNVVKVYHISEETDNVYIDYQKLTLSNETLKNHVSEFEADVQKGLHSLHSQNIILIHVDKILNF